MTGRGAETDFSLLDNYKAISYAKNLGTVIQTPFEFAKAFLANKKPPTSTLWPLPPTPPRDSTAAKVGVRPQNPDSLFPQVLQQTPVLLSILGVHLLLL